MARYYLGDLGGVEDLREAVRLGFDLGVGLEIVRAHINLGEVVWTSEGPAQALEVWRAGIDFGERRGMIGPLMWSKGQTLWALFDLGEWEKLLETADELISWDPAHGRSYSTVMALSYKAHVLVRQGAVTEAASLSEEFLPRARSIEDPQILAPALAVAALIDQARGRLPAALSLVEELEQETRDPFRANHVADAVRIYSAAGRLPQARKLLDAAPTAMLRHRHALLTGEAILSEAEGHHERAAQLYAEAMSCWSDYGFVLEQALALLGQGRCLLALEWPGAEQPLREARDLLAAMGCKPTVAETEGLVEQAAAAAL